MPGQATKHQDKPSFLKRHFGRLESVQEAKGAIEESAAVFYLAGALFVGLALFTGRGWADGAIYIGLAAIAHLKKSRLAGISLFLLSIAALATTASNRLVPIDSHYLEKAVGTGGRNIFWALIVAWAGYRITYASFRFQRLKPQLRQSEDKLHPGADRTTKADYLMKTSATLALTALTLLMVWRYAIYIPHSDQQKRKQAEAQVFCKKFVDAEKREASRFPSLPVSVWPSQDEEFIYESRERYEKECLY